jgi:Heparinase II/III-like protein
MPLRFHYSTIIRFLGILLVLPGSASANSQLDTLRPQHPRLFLHDSDLPKLKQAIAMDSFAKQQFDKLRAVGETFLATPPDTYQINGPEHTLLGTSRDMEGRIFTLAALYRVTGDKRFAVRATREMLAAADFPDWYPTHFLDTAEMTAALGLGYDWLYATLSPTDRASIKNAIVFKGIDPWLARVKSGKGHYINNWSQVCNGGETIGALAIADEEPSRANEVLNIARPAITEIMELFAPDGGFEEGPVYWNYATIYNVLYIDALDSALGTDFGTADATGFSSTADYHIQATGPTYQFANFGDAHPEAFISPQMFWFAQRFKNPVYAAYERGVALQPDLLASAQKESSRFAMLGLVWATRLTSGKGTTLLPIKSFSRINQAYLRSGWGDNKAWFVGFKGGDARASHGHLDLGSFVFDALGQRWAADLGPDSYGLPGYFGHQRWDYYRTRTEGHNTLTIDDQNQDLDAKAPLTLIAGSAGQLVAMADLRRTYKASLRSWIRGVKLLNESSMLVQDEVSPSKPVDIRWNFHTFAAVHVSPDGRSASLTQNGTTLLARILMPMDATFTTEGTQPSPPQSPNPGLSNLTVLLRQQSAAQTISVIFSSPESKVSSMIIPLSSWR